MNKNEWFIYIFSGIATTILTLAMEPAFSVLGVHGINGDYGVTLVAIATFFIVGIVAHQFSKTFKKNDNRD